jgi:uncharacterized membrane protein YphA (DoxX/SURF4 family)
MLENVILSISTLDLFLAIGVAARTIGVLMVILVIVSNFIFLVKNTDDTFGTKKQEFIFSVIFSSCISNCLSFQIVVKSLIPVSTIHMLFNT